MSGPTTMTNLIVMCIGRRGSINADRPIPPKIAVTDAEAILLREILVYRTLFKVFQDDSDEMADDFPLQFQPLRTYRITNVKAEWNTKTE